MQQKELIEELSPNLFRVVFSLDIYSQEALLSASQRLNDRFYVKIDPCGNNALSVTLQGKEDVNTQTVKKAMLEFVNDALEDQVRLNLMEKTGGLREIIYRHAFLPLEERKR
jgi:His-Xaa-Ser system protein HxsD